MANKIEWDKTGERTYETGVAKGVLYKYDGGKPGAGVAWNGLTTITESPSGAESNPQYADNMKYLDIRSAEEFGATIECFTYPEEFEECNGQAELSKGVVVGQQNRKKFGLSYVTRVGNDTNGSDLGYKIHLIWGATASPSEKAYATINDSPSPISFSFEITTDQVNVPGLKPTASMTIDSTKAPAEFITALEKKLYGSDTTPAALPTPDEIMSLLSSVNGSGTTRSSVPAQSIPSSSTK